MAVARTLRNPYGVGLSDLGDALSWGEAILLIEAAVNDPSTILGAELAGWAYPASTLDLLSLSAQIGDWKTARRVMPWVLEISRPQQPNASADEIAIAEAELESEFIFT